MSRNVRLRSASPAPIHAVEGTYRRRLRLSEAQFWGLGGLMLLPWVAFAVHCSHSIENTDLWSPEGRLTTCSLGRSVGEADCGEISLQLLRFSPTEEYLKLLDWKSHHNDWHFPIELSRQALRARLTKHGVKTELLDELMDVAWRDEHLHRWRIGVDNALIEKIPVQVRAGIYRELCYDRMNAAQNLVFRFPGVSSVDQWFEGLSLREEIKQAIGRHCYRADGYLRFGDLRLIEPLLRNEQERIAVLGALAQEVSYVARLRIEPGMDVSRLVRYWGRFGRSKDVRPLLESLAAQPGGGWLDIAHLLPPFARQRLNSYPPLPTDARDARRDCHWTAINFFNRSVDERLTVHGLAKVEEIWGLDYYEIFGAPRFGDLMTYVDEELTLYHSCVYIADGLVFTKNGASPFRGYRLMRLDEMDTFYERQTKHRVRVFRRKQS